MTDEEQKKQDELMDSRLADIEEARSRRGQLAALKVAFRHGYPYAAVGESASGVIYNGR